MVIDDDDQTIYVADHENDRIVEWKSDAIDGQIIIRGTGEKRVIKGCEVSGLSDIVIDNKTNAFIIADPVNRCIIRRSRENHMTTDEIIISDIDCWGLSMDKDGSLYTVDVVKDEVKQWRMKQTYEGTVVAGGNGEGENLNQLCWPTSVFIDEDYSLYISDYLNHRIMKWVKDAQEGTIVAGGNGEGNSLKHLSRPEGVLVDTLGRIYVADTYNHRVVRWCPEGKEGEIIIGAKGKGRERNQLHGPTRLYFDQEGNLFVVDKNNHRIQKFKRLN